MKNYYEPFIGKRIIKTVVAVYISVMITKLMGGMPINSAISAFLALLPTLDDSYSYAKNRFAGTFLGGIFAMAFVFLTDFFDFELFTWYYYLLMSFLLIPIIKTGQLINPKFVSSACICFLIALLSYISQDDLKYAYVISRVVDTLVGVSVAVATNFVSPYNKDYCTLKEIDEAQKKKVAEEYDTGK